MSQCLENAFWVECRDAKGVFHRVEIIQVAYHYAPATGTSITPIGTTWWDEERDATMIALNDGRTLELSEQKRPR